MTNPALPVDPEGAAIEVAGRPLRPQPRVYLLLNKPRGPLSTAHDPRGRRTVLDLFGDLRQRLYPAGRLDADTEGLLIITNDGDLTLRLTHPRYAVEKVYEAQVKGRPTAGALTRLGRGVTLTDGPTGPARVRVLQVGPETSCIELTVHSGRKRMVRRMLEAVGHPAVSLVRTRIGPLILGNLRPGEWRELTKEEVAGLRGVAAHRPRTARKPTPVSAGAAQNKAAPAREGGGRPTRARPFGCAQGKRR